MIFWVLSKFLFDFYLMMQNYADSRERGFNFVQNKVSYLSIVSFQTFCNCFFIVGKAGPFGPGLATTT